MNTLAQNLLLDLKDKLHTIHQESEDPMQLAPKAIQMIRRMLETLTNKLLHQEIINVKDEIHFFKEIKPLFSSQLLYYAALYTMESNKPLASKKALKKYYNGQLQKLELFRAENVAFYKYYKTGDTLLDHIYFTRGNQNPCTFVNGFFFQYDTRIATTHDAILAQFKANEALQKYIEDTKSSGRKKQNPAIKPLHWTASKVGLVELIYALQTAGTFNHGTADLKEIVRYFENIFQMQLDQFHRTFSEINDRKTERTKFLNVLSGKLLKRMEDNEAR